MAVSWTPHRFSGGALALDTANTVVLPADPARRFDRFGDAAEIKPFAAAASRHRSEELGGRELTVRDPERARAVILPLRSHIDAVFRHAAVQGSADPERLPHLLRACADGLETAASNDADQPVRFEAAVATSALSLLWPDRLRRIRICANCDWLFLDSSRNGSRIWCDMAVCGNREKARRHYARRTQPMETHHA